MPRRQMGKGSMNTLSEILQERGLPKDTIRKVISALEAHAGPPTPRSRSLLIRTGRRRWEFSKIVHTRVGEEDGGEWFTIHNLKL